MLSHFPCLLYSYFKKLETSSKMATNDCNTFFNSSLTPRCLSILSCIQPVSPRPGASQCCQENFERLSDPTVPWWSRFNNKVETMPFDKKLASPIFLFLLNLGFAKRWLSSLFRLCKLYFEIKFKSCRLT